MRFNMNITYTSDPRYNIKVSVQTQYLEEQSDPDHDRYVFAYTVTIVNEGEIPAQLLTRHWIIRDANEKVEEVRGEGVIGEQPYLEPGRGFRYTSGTMIETPVGTMGGSYQMVADDGTKFDAEIPEFSLTMPRTLH
jgi:ApaG protein